MSTGQLECMFRMEVVWAQCVECDSVVRHAGEIGIMS